MPVLRVSNFISLWTQPLSFQVQFMLSSRQLTFAWLQSQISHFVSLPCISGPKNTWETPCRLLDLCKLSGVSCKFLVSALCASE